MSLIAYLIINVNKPEQSYDNTSSLGKMRHYLTLWPLI